MFNGSFFQLFSFSRDLSAQQQLQILKMIGSRSINKACFVTLHKSASQRLSSTVCQHKVQFHSYTCINKNSQKEEPEKAFSSISP